MEAAYAAAGLHGIADTGVERRCLPGAKGARCETPQTLFTTAGRPRLPAARHE